MKLLDAYFVEVRGYKRGSETYNRKMFRMSRMSEPLSFSPAPAH